MYVDLERDIFEGRRHRHQSIGKETDHIFARMGPSGGRFQLSIFRDKVPRDVFERMRIFVTRFSLGIFELFPGRYGWGMGPISLFLVVR